MNEPEVFPDELAAVVKAASMLTVVVDQLTKPRSRHLQPAAVVGLAARTVPGAQFADLLAWRGGELISVAASAGYPPELDAIRQASRQGPCYEALNRTSPVISENVPEDPRWPTFGQRSCQATGVRSIASWKVRLSKTDTGALSCYSDWPYAFSEFAVACGSILANCCSVSLLSVA